jgi:hypothetical protein
MSAGMLNAAVLLAAPGQESPTLKPGLDPNQVAPGTIGFVVTFILVVAVVLLILDHTRRQRRMKNRFDYAMAREAEERRAREQGPAEAADPSAEASPAEAEDRDARPEGEAGEGPRGPSDR